MTYANLKKLIYRMIGSLILLSTKKGQIGNTLKKMFVPNIVSVETKGIRGNKGN